METVMAAAVTGAVGAPLSGSKGVELVGGSDLGGRWGDKGFSTLGWRLAALCFGGRE